MRPGLSTFRFSLSLDPTNKKPASFHLSDVTLHERSGEGENTSDARASEEGRVTGFLSL